MTTSTSRFTDRGPLRPFLRRHRVALVVALLSVVGLTVGVVLYAVRGEPGVPSRSGGVDTATRRAPACDGSGRTVVRPASAGVLSTQWQDPAPADDVTYDLSGVASTAYPATRSVFAV